METVLAACVKNTSAKTAGSNSAVTQDLKHPKMLHIQQRKRKMDKDHSEVRKAASHISVQTNGQTTATSSSP